MGALSRDVFEPENEVEAQAVGSLLEDHDIKAAIISFHDTAFDGVYQTQKGWGRIRVSAEDEELALELIDTWLEGEVGEDRPDDDDDDDDGDSEQDEIPATTKQRRMHGFMDRAWHSVGPFILAASIGLNVYLAYRLEPKINEATHSEYDSDGHLVAKFHYKKGAQVPHLVEEFDNKARLLAKHHDENADKRFETMSIYSPKEIVIEEHRDADADGRFEKVAHYHRLQLVARSEDENGDGRHERLRVFSGAHPRAEYFDADGDGRFDTIEHLTNQQGRSAKYTDRDKDGFPERVSCRGVGGVITLDTVPCKLVK